YYLQGIMQNSLNSFFRFVLGFSIFIAVSLAITYSVSVLSIKKEREEQTAAALRAMLYGPEEAAWWEVWK
ncbi:MAG: hypothetical protein WAZ27_00830, partial [Minisyncoccia bacterium]